MLPFTARIERAQFHRARSASKKGTWPLPPHPSETARCTSTGDHLVCPLMLPPSLLASLPTGQPSRSSIARVERGASDFPHFAMRESPDCPSLRALREHILIVRPQRARRMVWLFPCHPSEGARSASTEDQRGWEG